MASFVPFTDALYVSQVLNHAASADAVAILDSNFDQVFPNARPMRGEVIPRSRLMDHPLETGQIITDYKIVLPIEIVIPMLVPALFYRNTYQEIWNLWQTSELLTVQMRASNYPNMIIAELPHEEKPDMYDVITINLRFRQVQIVQPVSTYAPADPVNSDTQVSGQQNPVTIPSPSALTQQQITAQFLAGG